MRALLLLFACVSAACLQFGDPDEESSDSDDSSSPAPFAGTWVRGDVLFDCQHTLIFGKKDGNDMYEIDLACTLSTGGVGVQVEGGTYSVDEAGKATFVPAQATCPSENLSSHTKVLELIDAMHLRVETAAGLELYERSNPTPVGSIVLGCFDRTGNFAPRQLQDL
jgi:hypothetical protein